MYVLARPGPARVLPRLLLLVVLGALAACGPPAPADAPPRASGGAGDERPDGEGADDASDTSNSHVECAIVRALVVELPEFGEALALDRATIDAWTAAHAAEVDEAYAREAHRFVEREAEVRASHVLVSAAPDRARARAAAEAILARALAGEDFVSLARAESADRANASLGGDLGWAPRGRFIEEIDEAIFAVTAPGVIPRVLETSFGFHVVRVTGMRAAGTVPPEDARRDLGEALYVEGALAEAAMRRMLAAIGAARADGSGLAGVSAALGVASAERWLQPFSIAGPAGVDHRTLPASASPALFALGDGELHPAPIVLGRGAILAVAGGVHYPPAVTMACSPAAALPGAMLTESGLEDIVARTRARR